MQKPLFDYPENQAGKSIWKVVRLPANHAGRPPVAFLGSIINVASVPQLSPFRFPGGKTWLVPYVRCWLASIHPAPRILVEPFAGGASVSLTAVFEKLVDRVIMVELDDEVASVWQAILRDSAAALARQITEFEMSGAAVDALLAREPITPTQRAFATLVKNRTRYGGILAAGASPMRLGEDGRGLLSRWYPDTIRKRILTIAARRDCISFVHGDAMEFLEGAAKYRDVAFFVDPPYTVAGRRLYTHSDVDNERLFELVGQLRGDFLMTYDDAPEIAALASRHGLDVERIPMQGTKHSQKMELLIGRDLEWARHKLPSEYQFVADALLEDFETDG